MGEWPVHCFKAYDIRGLSGEELSDDFAYRLEERWQLTLSAHHLLSAEISENPVAMLLI